MSDGDSTIQNHRDIVTLRDYVDTKFGAVDKTLSATERSMEIRLERLNEAREDITRDRALYLTRTEHSVVHKGLEVTMEALRADIVALQLSRAELAGKATMASVYWTGVVSFMSLMLAVVSIVVAFIGH